MTSEFHASQHAANLVIAEQEWLKAHQRAEELTLNGASKEDVRRANGDRDRAEERMKNQRELLRTYQTAMRLEAVRIEIGAHAIKAGF